MIRKHGSIRAELWLHWGQLTPANFENSNGKLLYVVLIVPNDPTHSQRRTQWSSGLDLPLGSIIPHSIDILSSQRLLFHLGNLIAQTSGLWGQQPWWWRIVLTPAGEVTPVFMQLQVSYLLQPLLLTFLGLTVFVDLHGHHLVYPSSPDASVCTGSLHSCHDCKMAHFYFHCSLHARQWQAHGASLGDAKNATGAKPQDVIHV